jgi:hypothetical protein
MTLKNNLSLRNSIEDRPMTPEVWRAFRVQMGVTAERDVAKLLGISRNYVRSCDQYGAPIYIALACAAIKAGLTPYDDYPCPLHIALAFSAVKAGLKPYLHSNGKH